MAETGLRTNHQSRVDCGADTWNGSRKPTRASPSCAGSSMSASPRFTTGVETCPREFAEIAGTGCGRVLRRRLTTAVSFVPISIVEPIAGAELEIELNNSCMLRLKGIIDPSLLQAAITAAGQP